MTHQLPPKIDIFENATNGQVFDPNRFNLDQKALEETINKMLDDLIRHYGTLTGDDHDGRYFTETEVDNLISGLQSQITTNLNSFNTHKDSADHDERYYTKQEVVEYVASQIVAVSVPDGSLEDVKLSNSSNQLKSQALKKSMFTAANEFIIGGGIGTHVVKTLDQIKTLLGLGDKANLEGGNTFTGLQILSALKMKALGGVAGGKFVLQKPASGTTLLGDIAIDVDGDYIRIYDEGIGYKGAYLPIKTLLDSMGSELLTSSTTVFRKEAIGIGAVSINSLLTSGRYWSNSLTDLPVALQGKFLYIDVTRYDDLNILHKITGFTADAGTWIRYKDNGVWSDTFEMFNENSYGKVKPINAPKTLDLSDNRKFIYVVTGGVISIPHSSTIRFPIGATMAFAAYTGATISFLPVGVTELSSKDSKRTLNGVFSGATLKQVTLDSWWITGDLKA
jgi:hypothetical protein